MTRNKAPNFDQSPSINDADIKIDDKNNISLVNILTLKIINFMI